MLVAQVLVYFIFMYTISDVTSSQGEKSHDLEHEVKKEGECSPDYKNVGFTDPPTMEDTKLKTPVNKVRQFFNKISGNALENADKAETALTIAEGVMAVTKEFAKVSLDVAKAIPVIGLVATMIGAVSDYKAAAKEKRLLVESINNAFKEVNKKIEERIGAMEQYVDDTNIELEKSILDGEYRQMYTLLLSCLEMSDPADNKKCLRSQCSSIEAGFYKFAIYHDSVNHPSSSSPPVVFRRIDTNIIMFHSYVTTLLLPCQYIVYKLNLEGKDEKVEPVTKIFSDALKEKMEETKANEDSKDKLKDDLKVNEFEKVGTDDDAKRKEEKEKMMKGFWRDVKVKDGRIIEFGNIYAGVLRYVDNVAFSLKTKGWLQRPKILKSERDENKKKKFVCKGRVSKMVHTDCIVTLTFTDKKPHKETLDWYCKDEFDKVVKEAMEKVKKQVVTVYSNIIASLEEAIYQIEKEKQKLESSKKDIVVEPSEEPNSGTGPTDQGNAGNNTTTNAENQPPYEAIGEPKVSSPYRRNHGNYKNENVFGNLNQNYEKTD